MGMQGDFFQLLKAQGYQFGAPASTGSDMDLPNATTILAFKYRDGVLVAGDRRATAGNMVMYDRTDKVLEIDRHSVMAIAGVPATAYEMVRILEHSFKYYRRTQLQELSFEGKLRAVSKLLKENVAAALAGTGAVAPTHVQDRMDRVVALARLALGNAVFTRARAEGFAEPTMVFASTRITAALAAAPISAPIRPSRKPWPRTILSTSLRPAPIAIRTPISRVRRLTE